MNNLVKGYISYRENGGSISSFSEWLNEVENTAYQLDEEDAVIELDEDIIALGGYYDALCEDIEIRIKSKEKAKIKNTKAAVAKYHKVKEKAKLQGKEPPSFEEWAAKQQEAAELKSEMKKIGVKMVGAVSVPVAAAAGAVAAKKITDKHGITGRKHKVRVKTNNGNKIEYETSN